MNIPSKTLILAAVAAAATVIPAAAATELFDDDIWDQVTPKRQELPAVYLIRDLSKVVTYLGDDPWTGAPAEEFAHKIFTP